MEEEQQQKAKCKNETVKEKDFRLQVKFDFQLGIQMRILIVWVSLWTCAKFATSWCNVCLFACSAFVGWLENLLCDIRARKPCAIQSSVARLVVVVVVVVAAAALAEDEAAFVRSLRANTELAASKLALLDGWFFTRKTRVKLNLFPRKVNNNGNSPQMTQLTRRGQPTQVGTQISALKRRLGACKPSPRLQRQRFDSLLRVQIIKETFCCAVFFSCPRIK